MNKRVLIICIALLLIIAIIAIIVFLIKRNKIDYFIPGIDDYNNKQEYERQANSFGEDIFYEEDMEDFDYSTVERTYKGKLKEAQEIYNKVSLEDSMEDIVNVLGQPNEIDSDEELGYTNVLYTAPSGEYEVSFSLEDNYVYEKNLYLLASVRTGVFLSSELGTEIEDITTLTENLKEEMTLDEVIQILGDKYYEARKDYDYGTWLCWCDKKENVVSICFDDNVVVEIMY